MLGTYHLANPGHDVIRQDIDNVLDPKRQAELEDLVKRLAAWSPDRIAVEWPFSRTDTARARYARCRAGMVAQDRNEVLQIGFRLASRLGHDAVYPIGDDSLLDLNDSLTAVDERRPEFKRARDSIDAVLQQEAWRRTPRCDARNFNVAHHLTRMLRPDVKRILVIVGSGHVPPLRNLLDEAPQFCPVSPLSLLRELSFLERSFTGWRPSAAARDL